MLASAYIKREIDKAGKIAILSPPIAGGIYLCGTDPIPFGDRNINDGSDYVTIVGEVITGQLVAFFAERSMDSDSVIERNILLQEYYASEEFPDGAPTMMEMNRGEVAFREYQAKNKLHLLSRKATHLGHEFKDNKSKFGWEKNATSGTEALANDLLIRFLKLNAHQIRFERLIFELQRFPNGNNDLLDALRSYCINWSNYVRRVTVKYDRPETTLRPYRTMKNGIVVTEWQEVPLNR